jgi:heterotetrameric sarcosine oxidase gamma subunit
MSGGDLCITQLPARNLSLLQVQGGYDGELESLGDHLQTLGAGEDGPRAYSLGPTEWLLLDVSRQHIRRSLGELGRVLLRVTDVSASFSLLRITGSAARDLLAGRCSRTRLGQAEVIVQCAGGDSFDLYVEESLSQYVQAWLRARLPAARSTVQ